MANQLFIVGNDEQTRWNLALDYADRNLQGQSAAWKHKIQKDVLQLESYINVQGDEVKFYTKVSNNNSDMPTERRLNEADIFLVFGYALGIRKVNKTTGVMSNHPVFFSPDPQYFTGKSGTNKEFEELGAVYDGVLRLEQGTETIMKQHLTRLNLRNPNAQYLPVNGTTNEQFPEQKLTDAVDWRWDMQDLIGSQSYEYTLKLGKGTRLVLDGSVKADGTAEANLRNELVLFVMGYRIINASQTALANINVR